MAVFSQHSDLYIKNNVAEPLSYAGATQPGAAALKFTEHPVLYLHIA